MFCCFLCPTVGISVEPCPERRVTCQEKHNPSLCQGQTSSISAPCSRWPTWWALAYSLQVATGLMSSKLPPTALSFLQNSSQPTPDSSARLGTAEVAVSNSQIAVLVCVVAEGTKGQEGALHFRWVKKHLCSREGFHASVFWEEADLCFRGHTKTYRDSRSCSVLTVHLWCGLFISLASKYTILCSQVWQCQPHPQIYLWQSTL